MVKLIVLAILYIITITPVKAQSDNLMIYGFKDGMALAMQKIEPKGKVKNKAIISLVSGNWISNINMLDRYAAGAQIYADSGFTVFMVMHSSQPRYSIDDELEDVKRAVRFIRHYSRRLGVDSLNIGITGSSSGGHLSLLTALTNDSTYRSIDPVDKVSSRVQAVAVFFPPTDFLNWGRNNTGIRTGNLKAFGVAGAFDFKFMSKETGLYEHITDPAQIEAIAANLSPIQHIDSKDPPVMITHGDADPVVPIQQSETLIQALNKSGVTNKFILHKGGYHGWADSEIEKNQFIAWFNKYL